MRAGLASCLVALALLAACGLKGDPRPPEPPQQARPAPDRPAPDRPAPDRPDEGRTP